MRDPRSQSRQSITRARRLRQAQTAGEELVWNIVRGRRLGKKFRRQHPMGPYVVDFYCPELRFAIELDGTAHDTSEAREYDAYREMQLRQRGVTILRIRTEQVIANPRAVEAEIVREIADLERLRRRD